MFLSFHFCYYHSHNFTNPFTFIYLSPFSSSYSQYFFHVSCTRRLDRATDHFTFVVIIIASSISFPLSLHCTHATPSKTQNFRKAIHLRPLFLYPFISSPSIIFRKYMSLPHAQCSPRGLSRIIRNLRRKNKGKRDNNIS